MGDAFAALTNFTKKFSGSEVFPSPKLNEDQKKRFLPKMEVISPKSGEDQKKRKKRSSPEIEVIFSRNQVKTKKKVFAAICDHFRQEICRIF